MKCRCEYQNSPDKGYSKTRVGDFAKYDNVNYKQQGYYKERRYCKVTIRKAQFNMFVLMKFATYPFALFPCFFFIGKVISVKQATFSSTS